MRFEATAIDAIQIAKVLDQLVEADIVQPQHRLTLEISLTVCHLNGCPMDLEAMVRAGTTSDVIHDVYGINANVCRETGKLQNCFFPRFART